MADNAIEFEGAANAYSQLHERNLAGILPGFAQAFPSLAHAWMWADIVWLEVCEDLQNLIQPLCSYLTTVAYFDEPNSIRTRVGIKQGCPSSGTRIASSVDPLVRSQLANATLQYARICLFADDIALVSRCNRVQLGPLLAHMALWKGVSRLTLSIAKCMVIMLMGAEAEYQDILDREPCAAGMRLVWSATRLGVEVGPGAVETLCRMAARVLDIAAAPSLVGRIVLFTSHVSSLYAFKAQFANATREFRANLSMHCSAVQSRRGKHGRRSSFTSSRVWATHS